MARAYAYAGLISSGPLILSIFGMLLIGVMTLNTVVPKYAIVQFQVSVTYLIALSLILTGPLQLSFTRFISDRLFEKREDLVLSNYNGVVLVSTFASGFIGVVAMLLGFQHELLLYKLLMVAGFVTISNVWIAVIFLSSVKQYRQILIVFFIGYGCVVGFALGLSHYNLAGLLGGFVGGQVVLLGGLSGLIYRNYRSTRFISFEVFERRFAYPSLRAVGIVVQRRRVAGQVHVLVFAIDGNAGHRAVECLGDLRHSYFYRVCVRDAGDGDLSGPDRSGLRRVLRCVL